MKACTTRESFIFSLFLKGHRRNVAQIFSSKERKYEVMDVFESKIWVISLSYYPFLPNVSCSAL